MEILTLNPYNYLNGYKETAENAEEKLNIYKAKYFFIKDELEKLIKENDTLKNELKDQYLFNIVEKDVNTVQNKEQLITNLKFQIDQLVKEKNIVTEMLEEKNKEIDFLESEMIQHKENNYSQLADIEINNMNIEYSQNVKILENQKENLLDQLKKEKTQRHDLELANELLLKQNKQIKFDVEHKDKEIQKFSQGQEELFKNIKLLEEETNTLQTRFSEITKLKENLETALSKTHKVNQYLLKAENQARNKVEDALSCCEQAILERNNALLREAFLKDEIMKMQNASKEIIEIAGQRTKEEAQKLRKDYNSKLEELVMDIKKLENELCDKKNKLEKVCKHCSDLENLLESQREKDLFQMTNKKGLLESKIDEVYSRLCQEEQENYRLKSLNQKLNKEIRKLRDVYSKEIHKINGECNITANKFMETKNALESKINECEQLNITLKEVTDQIKYLEAQLESALFNNKLKIENENLLRQIEFLENQANETEKAYQKHLMSHKKIQAKLQQTIESLTIKFNNRIHEIKEENKYLKQNLKQRKH